MNFSLTDLQKNFACGASKISPRRAYFYSLGPDPFTGRLRKHNKKMLQQYLGSTTNRPNFGRVLFIFVVLLHLCSDAQNFGRRERLGTKIFCRVSRKGALPMQRRVCFGFDRWKTLEKNWVWNKNFLFCRKNFLQSLHTYTRVCYSTWLGL